MQTCRLLVPMEVIVCTQLCNVERICMYIYKSMVWVHVLLCGFLETMYVNNSHES